MEPIGSPIEKAYTAIVCGDGRILPIVESIGRRVLREINPCSREGRELLSAGKVALWSDNARRARRVPVDQVLKEMKAGLTARIAEHPGDGRWRDYHVGLARALNRSRKILSH